MLTLEKTKEAFEIAIENVGLKTFKKTSLFMSNNRKVDARTESKAA